MKRINFQLKFLYYFIIKYIKFIYIKFQENSLYFQVDIIITLFYISYLGLIFIIYFTILCKKKPLYNIIPLDKYPQFLFINKIQYTIYKI